MPAVKPKIVNGRIVNRWPGYVTDEEYAAIVARTERAIQKNHEDEVSNMARSVLKWRVEVHDRYWEPIAAFNAETVARKYAEDNLKAATERKLGYGYRVVGPRNKVLAVYNSGEVK